MTATLAATLRGAATGDVAEGVLIPLSQQGKLRVTYDWLYSALNCDPADDSDFVWTLTKVDDQHVVLSPRDQHWGQVLYASVRDDWNWFVQVQAPYSADWITAAGRDEILAIDGHDLLTLSLRGWNGQYVTVNPALSDHDSHSGYRLQSLNGDASARTFFLGVTRLLQPGLDLPLRSTLTQEAIAALLGPTVDATLPKYLFGQLS